jgi:perosamine synthetase
MDFIPQMEPWFDESEASALYRYMSAGGWVTEFKKTEEFEREICKFTGARHCVVVTNGTVSLSLALLALGVGPGDEVIVPDFTMIATPNSAKLIGAEPVFVDVDATTLCLDIGKVAGAITPRTRAVVHVSLNGRSNDLARLSEICQSHGLPLVEDAAQSLGSTFRGRHLGTVAQVGSFSFSAPKVITTGQGGALVTDDDTLAGRVRRLKDFGRARGGHDLHEQVGFNFKFTDVQAVIGLEQMKKLPWRIRRKKEIYRRYAQGLDTVEQVELVATDLGETAPWFVDIYVDDPDELHRHLGSLNIGTRRVYPPIHSQNAYRRAGDFPVACRYADRGLWLPSSSRLTDAQVDHVCAAIAAYYTAGGKCSSST